MKFIKANELYNAIEVKSCPFCGEKEEIFLEEYDHKAGLRWRIVCSNCMASIDRGYDQTPQPLIEAWNKRPVSK